MIRTTAKTKLAIATICLMLALNLSLGFLPSQANGKTAIQKDGRNVSKNLELFEQRGPNGDVVARLRVSPAASPDRFEFNLEDLQTRGQSVGTVEIRSNTLKVRFTDVESKTNLGMDARPDPKTPGRVWISLTHNKKRFETSIDGQRSSTISSRIGELVKQGKQEEAKRLLPEFHETIARGEEYSAFIKRIETSASFGILHTVVSLKGTLAAKETRNKTAVDAIRLAASMLAPGAARAAVASKAADRIRQQQAPRVIKAGYSISPSTRPVAVNVALHQEGLCNFYCPSLFLSALAGCYFEWSVCRAFFPDVDWWLCDSSLFACIDFAVLLLQWCEGAYCHAHPSPPSNPSADGNDMQPDEALYSGQSITSSNGQYTFIMQGDGNLVLYRNSDGAPLWNSGTWGNPGSYCILYADGELGIKTPDGSLIWYLPFMNSPGSYLIVQDDGNVVIYRPDGGVVWATNTSQ